MKIGGFDLTEIAIMGGICILVIALDKKFGLTAMLPF